MNRYIPTLCLAGLLLACSHENKRESDATRAERGHSSGEERAERRAEREQRREAREERAERVELRRRGDRDRMASRGDSLPEARDADNTAVNDRDADGANLTPMDQSNDERDLDITQQIRKSVVANDALSFGAKNVKIITRAGHVTLRGPVNSAAEKEAIFKTAVTHAGVGHVSNELEVDED